MKRGLFITFEGGEGTGKTTQSRLLADALKEDGYTVILTREPGGTPEGEALRDVFVGHHGQNWPLDAQVLLMFTARALHYQKLIRPAIEQGQIVISDRFADSTLCYQGYALGYDLEDFKTVKKLVLGDFDPDLTFVFDIDPHEGLIRASGREQQEDTFETLNFDFHEKLRQGYLKIAEENPQRCRLVDASREIEEIQEQILNQVRGAL